MRLKLRIGRQRSQAGETGETGEARADGRASVEGARQSSPVAPPVAAAGAEAGARAVGTATALTRVPVPQVPVPQVPASRTPMPRTEPRATAGWTVRAGSFCKAADVGRTAVTESGRAVIAVPAGRCGRWVYSVQR
jgi:hypothetical protein